MACSRKNILKKIKKIVPNEAQAIAVLDIYWVARSNLLYELLGEFEANGPEHCKELIGKLLIEE